MQHPFKHLRTQYFVEQRLCESRTFLIIMQHAMQIFIVVHPLSQSWPQWVSTPGHHALRGSEASMFTMWLYQFVVAL